MQELEAVVDLGRIRANARLIKKYAKKPLIAVVKDNAYGHGAEQVAHALSDMVCAFSVSTIDEGACLRTAGITAPILVFTPPLSREEAIRGAACDLTLTLSSFRSLSFMKGTGARAHLAVNTGMNRFGVRPDRVGALCRAAKGEVGISGVYSHLFLPEQKDIRLGQAAVFGRACEKVKSFFPDAVSHLSATGGILAGDCADFDLVRAGIALYGYLPHGFEGVPVKPVLKVYATVAESRTRCGDGAGYGYAGDVGSLYTLRVGYGDGFFRVGGLGVGDLCMDACVCAGRATAGRKKLIMRNAEEYASAHKTTAYEVLVNVTRKAVMRYRNVLP